jgi:hypothetical protein
MSEQPNTVPDPAPTPARGRSWLTALPLVAFAALAAIFAFPRR